MSIEHPTLSDWLFNLPAGQRYAIAFAVGVAVYAFLRWLIYLFNKGAKEAGIATATKKLNWKENLQNLAGQDK